MYDIIKNKVITSYPYMKCFDDYLPFYYIGRICKIYVFSRKRVSPAFLNLCFFLLDRFLRASLSVEYFDAHGLTFFSKINFM